MSSCQQALRFYTSEVMGHHTSFGTYAQMLLINTLADAFIRSRCLMIEWLVWVIIYIHSLYMRVVKSLVSLCICADSPEPSMLSNAISTIISHTGLLIILLWQHHTVQPTVLTTDYMKRHSVLKTVGCTVWTWILIIPMTKVRTYNMGRVSS